MKMVAILILLSASAASAGTSKVVGGAQVVTSAAPTSSPATACAQVCNTETFSTDPFSTVDGTRWTKSRFGDGITELCGFTWNGSTLKHTEDGVVGGCDINGFYSFARYNGDIAFDGCASFKIVTLGTGRQPGFIFRAGSSQLIGETNVLAGAIRCYENGATDVCRWHTLVRNEIHHNGFDEYPAVGEGPLGTLAAGRYLGACWRATGASTVVKVFELGTVDPGIPANTDGGASWGAAEITWDACGLGSPANSLCDDAGARVGVFFGGGGSAADLEIDDFRVFSCM